MNIKEIIAGVIGLACLVYGVIVYRVQSGTYTYMVWFMLGILCVAVAVGIHLHLGAHIPLVIRRIVTVLISLALLAFVIVEGCILSGFFAKPDDHLDYITVLGAQVYSSGPSDVLRYRLDAAYDYLIAHEGTTCIVSGGQGPNEPCAEAVVMQEYLIDKGIAKDRIIAETESYTTVDNILNSSVYFDTEQDAIGIVTTNYHVFRGIHIAKKLGIRNVCGIAADIRPLYLPNNMLREFFGIAKDVVYGNL